MAEVSTHGEDEGSFARRLVLFSGPLLKRDALIDRTKSLLKHKEIGVERMRRDANWNTRRCARARFTFASSAIWQV